MQLALNEFDKWKKRGFVFALDISLTLIAWIGAIWLSGSYFFIKLNSTSISLLVVMQSLIYILCGLYRGVWRFASIPDLIRIVRAVLIGILGIIIFVKFQAT